MIAVAAIVVNGAVLLALGVNGSSRVWPQARAAAWSVVVALAFRCARAGVAHQPRRCMGGRHIGRNQRLVHRASSAGRDISPLFRAADVSERLASVGCRCRSPRSAAIAVRFARGPTRGRHAALGPRGLALANAAHRDARVRRADRLPWRAAFWRPQGLPPTWVEPVLAGCCVSRPSRCALADWRSAVVLMTVARQTERMTSHDAK